ncbi:hypothetical protein KF707C_24970 [Metapseudomonas furukawaii]|uniref:Lipoprotein n=3 Tax=Metapseudomonas furukawaii TaxID=1149133 RepID=A0AAD1FES2_METFU|nr:hypothetical protein KF707C_24970 [Pseudomonas furukawaii]
MMKVEWETDPDPYAKSPPLGTDEFRKFMVKHKANYEHHTASVPLPPYEEEGLCALEVHFFPCHQVKVTTSCWRYPSPNSPIKEPLEMKEPAECPK